MPVSVRDSQIQMATGEQGTTILQGIRNASKSFDQPLRFPVVLKAPHNHTPKPDPALPTPALLPPLPTPAPIKPISTEMPPEEAYSPENIPNADIERYEAPAPNSRLGESDALFPAEPIPADSFQMETFPTETFTRPPDSLDSDSLDSDSLDSDSLDFVEPSELHGAIPVMTVSSAAADITLPETISLAGLKDSYKDPLERLDASEGLAYFPAKP
ncbi:MAG: hypothetical protein AAFR25_07585 [Cyanobacteria bacterium J06629_19]